MLFSHCLGITPVFLLFHTHYDCLVKNHARNKESPSKKPGLMFQLFYLYVSIASSRLMPSSIASRRFAFTSWISFMRSPVNE